jgi:hypothetical protein
MRPNGGDREISQALPTHCTVSFDKTPNKSGMDQLLATILSAGAVEENAFQGRDCYISSLNVPALRQLLRVLEGRRWEYRAGLASDFCGPYLTAATISWKGRITLTT